MNKINNSDKKAMGFNGELFVIDKLKTLGFILYKRNIKYINSEIDIVMYRFNLKKMVLDIRVIEVKTRSGFDFNLSNFNLIKKWSLIKPYMYEIKSEIDKKFKFLPYSEIHFDLALIKKKGLDLSFYSYNKDINLLI